jgi:hypothetical protein
MVIKNRFGSYRPSSFRDASRVGTGLVANGTTIATGGRCSHVGARYLGLTRISDGACRARLYTADEIKSGLCCNCASRNKEVA